MSWNICSSISLICKKQFSEHLSNDLPFTLELLQKVVTLNTVDGLLKKCQEIYIFITIYFVFSQINLSCLLHLPLMPAPQVPFFLKNQILQEVHHYWAEYSIYTAILAVNFHKKPWMVNWSWHISFGPESSTMCKTRSVTQKSTSCDMWCSMPCGRRKEMKKWPQMNSGTTQMQISSYNSFILLYSAQILIFITLSPILITR